jgi:hypothetical protein
MGDRIKHLRDKMLGRQTKFIISALLTYFV